MPELPEVETIKRGLEAQLQGQRIKDIELYCQRLRKPIPVSLPQQLKNKSILSFSRRAKYILAHLDTAQILLFHLGMSGRMLIRPFGNNEPKAKHEHFTLTMHDGIKLSYIDPRRFGMIDLYENQALLDNQILGKLGPEPLADSPILEENHRNFLINYLQEKLAHRRQPIKTLLLDQYLIVGLGNIYVCEALFKAGISPLRSADTLSMQEIEKLVDSIQITLMDAINAGGSSMRDYVHADGSTGYFQMSWQVYDREGELCINCKKQHRQSIILRIVQGGRSTFFCPVCQK